MILVTGATGNVGFELCRSLAESGEPVRGLIRDDSRRARLPAGVEGVVGDLNDPDSLAPALDGVRGVHLLAGYAGLPAALERMKAAGVERVTLQSSSAVPDGDTTNAVARYHIESEAAIRASRLAWTFLQPVLDARRHGRVRGALHVPGRAAARRVRADQIGRAH